MYKEIHKHPKANSNGFKENPDHINRSGKRSILSEVAKNLEKNEAIVLNNVDEVDENNEPTGRKVNVKLNAMSFEVMGLHYLQRAKKSDRVLIDLMDRLYGKPTQRVDQRIDLNTISDDNIELLFNHISQNLENE